MAKPDETTLEPREQSRGLLAFFSDSWRELRKVRWPNRREVVNYTAAALITCLVLGLLVWGFDIGIAKLLSLIGVV
ncbi:preprotein translocase subunit SecE [Alicyclobacillus tolerans]|uniref:Protein translocase subunit SecE n=2 Tax=Alicyclobacillus tolerans TaxID=90970 RepID=A0A1M6VKT2_9BACL|nr:MULTISPECIES: preprotein translocase subunit SecE [Alicyclobacillus]MDP9728487.1 preprotein translocase subunit SecE [Alicyclobacillus tengchongensis]QRF22488.1 preprotein translocase subunit SecE [Alicyclobacillus sp. TC]SHK82113.1 protein translocase subunit secE/sec61 gamma [Alicyclobacillus montanus]